MTVKESRIAVRMTTAQDALIRCAAETEGLTVTDFTVSAALSRANEVLADQRLFVLDDAAWTEFQALLDRPVEYKPALAKLLATDSVFG